MKRILHIARGYGVAALVGRAVARASARLSEVRHAARSRRSARSAMRLPKSPESVSFAAVRDPVLTVLVTDARDWRRANRCLRLLRTMQDEIALEVAVAYDPAIERELRRHEGVRLLTHVAGTPLEPLLARGAEGHGRFLLLVAADAIPSRAAIDRQLRAIERDVEIAAALPQTSVFGSMLRMEFVRAALPEMPANADWAEAVGWLCGFASARGLRCLYHDDDVVSVRLVPAAGNLLVVDEHVPFDDRDAGSRRISALMGFARDARWNVAFGSLDARAYEPYARRLKESGVELLLGFRTRKLAELTARGDRFDCVWLSRAHVAEDFADAVRSLQPQARIVYDTVDLHHLRLARQEEAISKRTRWAEVERAELESARKSDVVVVTSSAEEALLEKKGIARIAIVGLAEPVRARMSSYVGTEGVLFVGNYAHEPNVDAALWLAGEIMPLVWREIPEATLTLAGADPTASIRRLADPRVRVPGFMASLEPMLQQARVFAAPLRFGAGLKGKIVLALAAGLPVVTTSVGAEGIAEGPDDLAVAAGARAFADAIVRIYRDEAEWRRYAAGAHRAALRFSPQELARSFRAVLETTS